MKDLLRSWRRPEGHFNLGTELHIVIYTVFLYLGIRYSYSTYMYWIYHFKCIAAGSCLELAAVRPVAHPRRDGIHRSSAVGLQPSLRPGRRRSRGKLQELNILARGLWSTATAAVSQRYLGQGGNERELRRA